MLQTESRKGCRSSPVVILVLVSPIITNITGLQCFYIVGWVTARKITRPVKQENSATANKLHNAYLQITFSNAFAYALESQKKSPLLNLL